MRLELQAELGLNALDAKSAKRVRRENCGDSPLLTLACLDRKLTGAIGRSFLHLAKALPLPNHDIATVATLTTATMLKIRVRGSVACSVPQRLHKDINIRRDPIRGSVCTC